MTGVPREDPVDGRYDVIVIGAGPGGYVCAIRAAQLGQRVLVIDRRTSPGGTCLNVGCIPSKALLHVTGDFHRAQTTSAGTGIAYDNLRFDLAAMQTYKESVVDANRKGVNFLFRKYGVDLQVGTATFVDSQTVRVESDGNAPTEFRAHHIVIATGAELSVPSGLTIDERDVLTSTGALALAKVPDHLLVVGAGAIGLEIGSIWRRLGARVTLVEYFDQIAGGADAECARDLMQSLTRQGMAFMFGQRVARIERSNSAGPLQVTLAKAHAQEDGSVIEVDKVLVATGRRPHTSGLGLESLGLSCDRDGRIPVDACFRTVVRGIYAIGDVTAGPMLAHKASDDGVMVAEVIACQRSTPIRTHVPFVIYTEPELAWIGETEAQLDAAGIAYRKGEAPFSANGRARASGATAGKIKVLAAAEDDRIIGVHILGEGAGELIHAAAVGMAFAGASEDVALTTFAHPTFSETFREAALQLTGSAIHG